MHEQLIRCHSVDLNYAVGPNNGQSILLLHGACSRWQSFLPIIPDLMSHLQVHAMDFRGHGKSARTTSYRLNDYAQDVSSLIKEHIKKPTIIFGNSFGGMVAIMTAAYHPEGVQAVIIGDAPITMSRLQKLMDSQRDLAHQVIHWLNTNQVENIYQAIKNDFFAESLSLCDPQMLSAMFAEFASTFSDYSTSELFPLIHCPVFIIRGNVMKGSLISDADMHDAAKLIANLGEVQLPNASHSLLEETASLTNEIHSFVNQLMERPLD